jgi:hypothetical protein
LLSESSIAIPRNIIEYTNATSEAWYGNGFRQCHPSAHQATTHILSTIKSAFFVAKERN